MTDKMEETHYTQAYAIEIEHTLRSQDLASDNDAKYIRKSPIDFISRALRREGKNEAYTTFLNEYEEYQGKKLDDFDEETAEQLVKDVRALFLE